MYIEFSLSSHNSAQGAAYANQLITQALHEWSDQYQIPYNVKNQKLFKRITFDSDELYSFFAVTWNPKQKHHALSRWRLVSDLNNKSTFDSVL